MFKISYLNCAINYDVRVHEHWQGYLKVSPKHKKQQFSTQASRFMIKYVLFVNEFFAWATESFPASFPGLISQYSQALGKWNLSAANETLNLERNYSFLFVIFIFSVLLFCKS